MANVKHKFINYRNKKNIEILILGTFNPDVKDNKADFFYGRSKNYLWDILPAIYGHAGLKGKSEQTKNDFIEKHNIGFADIIEEVNVDAGKENNYSDRYIDGKVVKWTDIEAVLNACRNIQKIYFTRKTLSDVPNMKKQITKIVELCNKRNIQFNYVPTPARFNNVKKLNEWKEAFGK